MNIIKMIADKKKEELKLKNKYLNKSVCLNRGGVSIVYHVHKVRKGWLYCYHGNEEIRFRPYDIILEQYK